MPITFLPMDCYYWFCGLPNPREDVSHLSKNDLRIYHMRKHHYSPYFKIVDNLQRIRPFCKAMIRKSLERVWHATIGPYIFVKWARTPDEAATMRFVTCHTSIPIPRVRLSFPWFRGTQCILMDRIHNAVELFDVWDSLSPEEKEIIAEQLRGYIAELRSITPVNGRNSICSVSGGSIQCFRLHRDATTGPFRDEEHMNFQLCHGLSLDDPRFPPLLRKMHNKKHSLVFTHNDFFPWNIMVDEKHPENVVAIIDWECAGWYPAHWEFCKSSNWCTWRSAKDWITLYVPKIMPVFEEEAEADKMLMYEGDLPLSPVLHYA